MIASRPIFPRRPGERGFALLIVLWTLAGLSLLVGRIGADTRAETRVAFDLRSNLVQEANANGAIYAAAFHLLDRSERQWNSDGALHELSQQGGTVEVRITDEADKVNLNTASADLLSQLLIAVGTDTLTAERLGSAIVEWREQASSPSVAETQAMPYRAAGLGYLPPHAAFRGLDEVGLVLGVTPDLVRRLKPHLTIYSTYGPARSTADPVVRKALREVRAAAGLLPLEVDSNGVRVVRVIAAATGRDGTRFTRDTVLRLKPGQKDRSFSILAWNAGEDAEQ